MVKLLSTILLILTVFLGPPATLAVISNDAVPGEPTYLIKRKLEDAIVLAASISPQTKAWFSANRSERRFKEVNKLLAVKSSETTNALAELVSQTNQAANELSGIKETNARERYIDDLTVSIGKYNKSLQAARLSATPDYAFANNFSQSVPEQQPENTQIANSTVSNNTAGTAELVTPSTDPSGTQTSNGGSNVTLVTPPTSTAGSASLSEADKKREKEIEETRKQLEEIKKALEEEKRKIEEEKQKYDFNRVIEEQKRENDQKREENNRRMQQQQSPKPTLSSSPSSTPKPK